eukprot:gene1084-1149_t
MGEIDELWHSRHDIFNLLVLPLVIGANCLYLFESYDWYWIQFWSFFLYILVDTLWLIIKPRSVVSPCAIIAHHIVCIIGWVLPALYDQIYADWVSYGLLVEVNTWFLIARRTWKDVAFFGFCFYLCWFTLRLIMYPVILYRFSKLIYEKGFSEVHYTAFIQWVFMVALTSLNYKWTLDMVIKMFGDRSKGASEDKKGL